MTQGEAAGDGWTGVAVCPCDDARMSAVRRNWGSTLFDQTSGL
jgi:hypothetical protein